MSAVRTPDYSYHALRLALGLIYLYFGFLKFFPDVSPAEGLAIETIVYLSGGLLPPQVAILSLAVLEFGLGLALVLNRGMRWAFWLFLFHMAGTFAPLVIFPAVTFRVPGLIPTLEGQYILKNLVFVAVAWPVFWPYVSRARPTRVLSQSTLTTPAPPSRSLGHRPTRRASRAAVSAQSSRVPAARST